MLAQLEERGLVKSGEAVGHLVACADEVRLDRAVELALAAAVLPALVVLSLLQCASVISLFNSCRVVHKQQGGMLSRVDDEILERDNRTTGRIRQNMLFWSGSSDPVQAAQTRHVMRPVLDAEGQQTGDLLVCCSGASCCAWCASRRSSRKRPVRYSAQKALEAQVRAEARAAVKADIDDELKGFAVEQ
eukprot:102686-Pleurochrysis_carterae.AAC.1